MRSLKEKISWNHVWLGLFAIGFGIFFIVTPKYYDDYWYMVDMAEWYGEQGIWYPTEGGDIFNYGIPWDAISKTVSYHLEEDTARLCNVVGTFVLLFPKWLVSSIAWIFWLFSVWGCFRLAGVNIRRSWLVSVGIGMWTLTFLWYDTMGDIIYQYNYLVSGGLCVGLLLLLRRKPTGVARMVWLVLLSMLTALWHEGFTAPLLVSFIVAMICFKDCRNRAVLIVTVIMLAGMIWHFAGTSTLDRANSGFIGINLKLLLRNIYYHRAMWVMGITAVIFICRNGFRAFFTDRLLVFMLAGTIVALGMAYFIDIHRAAWWGDIASVIMVLYMLRRLDLRVRDYKGWRGVVAMLILAGSYFELGALDVYTIKFAREYPEIIGKYIKDPGQTQFSELIDYPWVGLPFMQMMHNEKFYYAEYLRDYYHKADKNAAKLVVIPESLRNIKTEDCTPLEGNLGLMKCGRFIVAPSESEEISIVMADIDYGWFKVRSRILEYIPFRSAADGQRYVYVVPVLSRTEYEVGDIKGVYAAQ